MPQWHVSHAINSYHFMKLIESRMIMLRIALSFKYGIKMFVGIMIDVLPFISAVACRKSKCFVMGASITP